MTSSSNQNVYNVSKLNNEIKRLLEGNFGRVWLSGEISNFVAASSGHWYFTLKDHKSQIKCAMFRGRNRSVSFLPKNGQQILVKANISVYEPRGDYQLLIDIMDVAGDGLLQQQFEQLKCQLAAEGLFASEHKKALPSSPKTIGVVTSPTGAAVRDIISVLQRRNPTVNIIIYPTLVQGAQASNDIINAINIANQRNEVDLLIVGRGGGSLEDLWCFNDEALARTIFNSQLPIISAVGHEIDITISDFVADYRAPTPSAAAEIAVDTTEELRHRLHYCQQHLTSSINAILAQRQLKLQQLQQRLVSQDPKYRLQQQAQYLDEMTTRLTRAMTLRLNNQRYKMGQLSQRLLAKNPQGALNQSVERSKQLELRLHQAIKSMLKTKQASLHATLRELNSVSPLATLERGYSITVDEHNQVISDLKGLKPQQKIISRLAQGTITSVIERVDAICNK
ncbi:MAG: exodeoxyribonuclease VII large subunit [Gammaproteobacteria bacterium]|nr:exodeoxyribonuclease VII large subunit [Gammaproteobacteria bacterium]